MTIGPIRSEEAIAWFVRLRSGEVTAEERRRCAEWRAADPQNERTYAEIERLWDEIGEVLPRRAGALLGARRTAGPTGAPRRRTLWRGVLAAGALTALAVLLHVLHLTDPWLSDHYTATGEQREIRLADGSTVLLNTDSALSLASTATARRIVLDRGQARFTVAPDPEHPFEVVAGAATVRALGTVFEVYRVNEAETRVIVQADAVELRVDGTAGTGGDTAVREIAAGQALAYRAGRPLGQPEAVDLAYATAWQGRRLLLNDRPLTEAIGELNRYRHGTILITDDLIAGLPITGVFPLDDPEGALRAIETGLRLKTTRLSPLLVLLHR